MTPNLGHNRAMKKLNVYLSDQQYATLLELAAQTDVSMAESIRRALDAWIRQQHRPTPESIYTMSMPELTAVVHALATRFDAIAQQPLAQED